MTDRPTGGQLTWRYVSGARLDGQPHTSSSAWARMPRWKRAAWRVGTPAALLAADLTHVAHPLATDAALAGLAVAGARAVRGRWRTRRFRRTYIHPTLAALKPALGDAPVRLYVDPGLGTLLTRLVKPMSPAELAVRTWYGAHLEPVLRWAPDHAQRAAWTTQGWLRPAFAPVVTALRRPREDRPPRIELRASVPFVASEQRQLVEAVIAAKLPAGELNSPAWDQVGQQVTVVWTVRRRPPTQVGYADLIARFDDLEEWRYFAGLGIGSTPVIVDLQQDSPHIALSAGTGAGKSALAQLIGVQVLARGGSVVILDRKGSHRWALGLDGVDYCTRPEQMHQALTRLADLADQRNADAFREPEGWDPGPRVLVIAEELNATFAQLRAWWDEVRDPGQPRIPPSVRAFRELLFMGRSAKVNVLAVAQMLTANTTGGPESRENFGVRCLARYTRNNWQMLVPEASMPRASRTLGRWQIVVGGTATETQVCYLTAPQARLFVARGRGVPERGRTPLMAPDLEKSQGHGHVRDMTDPMDALITLPDAAERGAVPWAYEAARKRLRRAREAGRLVPEPVRREGNADLYRLGDVLAWVDRELIP